jgi:hypothetical protein
MSLCLSSVKKRAIYQSTEYTSISLNILNWTIKINGKIHKIHWTNSVSNKLRYLKKYKDYLFNSNIPSA